MVRESVRAAGVVTLVMMDPQPLSPRTRQSGRIARAARRWKWLLSVLSSVAFGLWIASHWVGLEVGKIGAMGCFVGVVVPCISVEPGSLDLNSFDHENPPWGGWS